MAVAVVETQKNVFLFFGKNWYATTLLVHLIDALKMSSANCFFSSSEKNNETGPNKIPRL